MPLAISARIIELGPTKGFTVAFNCWAAATKISPGSAIAGHPASLMIAMFYPCCNKFLKFDTTSFSALCITYHW